MSELYIYLGRQENKERLFHFFIHPEINDKYKFLNYNLDTQIYNCMINETMIQSPNEVCIIFSIFKDTDYIINIDKESILKLLPYLIEIANKQIENKKLSFKYFYDKNYFLSFEQSYNIKNIDENILKNFDFEYYITTKNIDYI